MGLALSCALVLLFFLLGANYERQIGQPAGWETDFFLSRRFFWFFFFFLLLLGASERVILAFIGIFWGAFFFFGFG